MNLHKLGVCASLALAFGAVTVQAHAANLVAGDQLAITAGVPAFNASSTQTNVSSGSWFGMDTNGDSKIQGSEKVALSQGTQGILIGTTQAVGAHHGGAPTGADTNLIDAPWRFAGNTGSHFTASAITGGTAGGLAMGGWRVAWNMVDSIPMNAAAWNPLNCPTLGVTTCSFTNSIGNFEWDGVYGHTYKINYTATVPAGDPSGFGGTQYMVHLEGTVVSGSAPQVASTLPANGAGGVASNLNKYVVEFNKAMDTATVTTGTITLDNGATVSAVNCATSKKICVFTLAGVAAATYTVTFHAGPTDLTGLALALPANKTFTAVSADNTAPTVTTSPANAATDVDSGVTITLTFIEVMDLVTVQSAFSLTGGGSTIAGTLSTTDSIVYTFTPTAALAAGTTYTIGIAAAAKDLANNALALTANTFTIAAAAAGVAPSVPASGGAGGGCVFSPRGGAVDLSLLLAALASLGFVVWGRRHN